MTSDSSSCDWDLLGVGHALMDLVFYVSEAWLRESTLTKASVRLVDTEAALNQFMAQRPPDAVTAGGAAANTVAHFSKLGGSAAFMGRLGADELGQRYLEALAQSRVAYCGERGSGSTGRCLVAVTPDAERTMVVFLGSAGQFSVFQPAELLRARRLYLEGYLYDQALPRETLRRAAGLVRQAGREVAFSLSDALCVERHRTEFQSLLRDSVDILFGNLAEAQALFPGLAPAALFAHIARQVKLACITEGAQGAHILQAHGHQHVHYHLPAQTGLSVVDTTGAGDAFAAGFLYGYGRDMALEACGELGHTTAAGVLTQIGARLDGGRPNG